MVPEEDGALKHHQSTNEQQGVHAPRQKQLNQSHTLWTDCPEAHPSLEHREGFGA